ncbi:MAG: hypothetical protein FD130_1316 [Halothiobacillaceae bacterium]|nr:MAG: hypothetical protein FD130_1316 [Halothiobacillaceae bacterium]
MAITTAKGDLQSAIDKNHAEITTQLATTKGDLQSEFSQNIAATNGEIASNKAAIAEVKGSFGELRQQLSDRVQAIESAHTTLTAQLQEAKADLNRAISRNQITWTAAEVEHILQIANEQIQLEKSVVKAVTTLRSADQRLQSTPDPAFIKVRDAIQKEIAALNGVVVPDIHGTALTLSRLADDVPTLSTAPTVNRGRCR